MEEKTPINTPAPTKWQIYSHIKTDYKQSGHVMAQSKEDAQKFVATQFGVQDMVTLSPIEDYSILVTERKKLADLINLKKEMFRRLSVIDSEIQNQQKVADQAAKTFNTLNLKIFTGCFCQPYIVSSEDLQHAKPGVGNGNARSIYELDLNAEVPIVPTWMPLVSKMI